MRLSWVTMMTDRSGERATSRSKSINSESAPVEIVPKLFAPSTRPQPSTSGPPLLPPPIGAVWRIESTSFDERPDETLPRVFTGGIGENDILVREQICDGLAWAGVHSGFAGQSDWPTGCRVRVIKSRENEEIALHSHLIVSEPHTIEADLKSR